MPKVGIEPIRRQQLIEATISAISEHGFADTTISRISRAAGVSAGIIHHYFGGKNELLEAAMRSLLQDLHAEVSRRLEGVSDPRERLYAIIDGNFTEAQFAPQAITAWMALWNQARYAPALARLQRIYARRLRSNLLHALRQLLSPGEAERAAFALAVMIDGLSLQSALRPDGVPPQEARALVRDYLDRLLEQPQLAAV
ncbi:MAG TPA: transcriptional regulator BetI [Candidatus Competibacteraceae bacterium]|nr:transcriptional regulator BetI [Candidatus Competibacteraceae bacterium]